MLSGAVPSGPWSHERAEEAIDRLRAQVEAAKRSFDEETQRDRVDAERRATALARYREALTRFSKALLG